MYNHVFPPVRKQGNWENSHLSRATSAPPGAPGLRWPWHRNGTCGGGIRRGESGIVDFFLVGGLENHRKTIGSGWWFGTCSIFFHILGIIIPTDFHILQRGWNHQPVFLGGKTIRKGKEKTWNIWYVTCYPFWDSWIDNWYLPNGFHSWLSQLVVLGEDSRLHMDTMEVCGSLKKHATQTGHGVREN